ncbi:MAG: arginine decarboxylase [Rhodothermales bacterium]|jgi:arginine decarboxylase
MAGKPLRRTTPDTSRLYNLPGWGQGYYKVGPDGHLCVHPRRGRRSIDLDALVDDLSRRDIHPPVLVRFLDVLEDRVRGIDQAFRHAIAEFAYGGSYHPVYPIKVNQQRQVAESILAAGKSCGLGMEVGSKPELLAALALVPAGDRLIICNGYKDASYIELALRATTMDRRVILVIEKVGEIGAILEVSRRTGITPMLGVRAQLSVRLGGHWASTTGDGAKFGLNTQELLAAIEMLRETELLPALELLHMHIGSQISQIGWFKSALTEIGRTYVELRQLGAPLRNVDVGGGLGVDYDGSASTHSFSMNYSVAEYANDVVFALGEVCSRAGQPCPDIITESGRAITAHYSVLIVDVTEQRQPCTPRDFAEIALPPQLSEFESLIANLTPANCREYYHDASYLRKSALNMYNLGLLSLAQRARVESIYWDLVTRVNQLRGLAGLDHEEFAGLDRALATTCYLNFSLFQSLPDHWAIGQPFPIMPIHRLNEEPDLLCTLADITCDSDGRIERFITRDRDDLIPLHRKHEDSPYRLGIFLVGAYQEVLGDLHNLFGDTNAVHVSLDRSGSYRVHDVIRGDSATDVLRYMQYDPRRLIDSVRGFAESAVARGAISIDDSTAFIRAYEAALAANTYLQ